ncbi:hypothetical protein BDV97DRAFT_400324 [Delphinella strobiligena]|nr:hypothetical protein BDV97DRAFT_400324 [Delphinella strobiligena]
MSSVTAISCVRLAAMLQIDMNDFSFGMLASIRWTIVETSVAILNACFPMMRPLIRRLAPKLFSSTDDNTNSYPSQARDPNTPRSGIRRTIVVRSSIEDDEIELTRPEKHPELSTTFVTDSRGTREGSFSP